MWPYFDECFFFYVWPSFVNMWPYFLAWLHFDGWPFFYVAVFCSLFSVLFP